MNNEKYNGIGNCYPFKSRCWETKDHHIIKISDMETSHIENAINFLERTKDFYDEVLRIFPDYKRCNKWLKDNGGVYLKRVSLVGTTV